MREPKTPDIELIIKCALDCGATVTIGGEKSGVFLNGEEFNVKDIFTEVFPDWETHGK